MSESEYHHPPRSYTHNSTITTSVSIRVTPGEDFLVSWGVLWAGFILTSFVAAYQVWKDQKLLSSRADDIENGRGGVPGDEGVSSADMTRSMVSNPYPLHPNDTMAMINVLTDLALTVLRNSRFPSSFGVGCC